MSNEREKARMQHRGRGPMGRGMQPGEKPKDLKGSLGKLLSYIGNFKAAIIVVMIFAAASTVFNVIGPKILGKATTALSEGLMAKIQGTGSIDFTYIGKILLLVLGLYVCSAAFNFIQGWIMTGVTQKICYRMRKEISEKINRMPMKYFESRTYGEVLSRITNDVDTLGQGLNQSITTIITSVATLVGVLIMMLSISPLMTLIAIVILPISMALISFVVKKSQKYFKDQQEYLGHINGQVEEVYGGHLVIKAFNREKDTIEEFNRTNEILYQSAWKSQFLSGMMQPIMMFVGNLGYAPGQTPGLSTLAFPADEALRRAAVDAAAELNIQTWEGRVASGDVFVREDVDKNRIADTFDASCCEMEGAAIAQVCWLNRVPFAIVRAISDKADGTDYIDYPTFEAQAARQCAALVTRMIGRLV